MNAMKRMVDRFLSWRLPDGFCPDCGISFDGRKDDEWNKNKTWPVGTNLLSADQAQQMLEHVIGQGMNYEPSTEEEGDAYMHGFFDGKEKAEATLAAVTAEIQELSAEVRRLNALINTPHTADWMSAVSIEAAHQRERWGANHDAGKEPQDWFWLLGYLGGKALAAFMHGDREKGLHHIVNTSAALLNWHRHVTGEDTAMRPGIDPVARGLETAR